MNKASRICATFEFNERAKKMVDPAKLSQLLQASCKIFQQVYMPERKRLGVKFLEKELFGSNYLSIWPATFREVIRIKETDFPLKMNEAEATDLSKKNSLAYESMPMQTRHVYQSFMRMNDVRRKKKLRSITAIKAKKGK